VLLLSMLIIKEKLTLIKGIGLAVGLTGAILLIQASGKSSSNSSILGDIFIFLNACSYGIYLILVKPLMKTYSPLTVVRWAFTFGLLFVIPFGVPGLGDVNWDMPNYIILEIGFVIVFTTFFAYLLNILGLKRVSPTAASAFVYLQPILTAIIATIGGRESLTMHSVLCGLLIFIGVFLVSYQFPVKKEIPSDVKS